MESFVIFTSCALLYWVWANWIDCQYKLYFLFVLENNKFIPSGPFKVIFLNLLFLWLPVKHNNFSFFYYRNSNRSWFITRHSTSRFFLRGQNLSFEILRKKKCKNFTKNYLICVKYEEEKNQKGVDMHES